MGSLCGAVPFCFIMGAMSDFPYLIRPVDSSGDAEEVAALIRKSFRSWLDQENTDFLRKLAAAGKSFKEKPFLGMLKGGFPYELRGVVCVDPNIGRIVGNTGVYYYPINGVPSTLIANVCVDPAYRGQGIASRMLADVETEQRRQNARGLYLQARMELPAVINMYRARGFKITDYRNEWIRPRGKALPNRADGLISKRITNTAALRTCFEARYPGSILWNLLFNPAVFDTSPLRIAERRLRGDCTGCREFINSNGAVAGWAGWQHFPGITDTLWLIPNGQCGADQLAALLAAAVAAYPGKKALKINTPAEDSAEVYQKAGFEILHALAWMWKPL